MSKSWCVLLNLRARRHSVCHPLWPFWLKPLLSYSIPFLAIMASSGGSDTLHSGNSAEWFSKAIAGALAAQLSGKQQLVRVITAIMRESSFQHEKKHVSDNDGTAIFCLSVADIAVSYEVQDTMNCVRPVILR